MNLQVAAQQVAMWWHRRLHDVRAAYDLDAYRPSQAEINSFAQAPSYCHRCEQLSAGMAWEPQTGEGLCMECYERSEYAHRRFRWI